MNQTITNAIALVQLGQERFLKTFQYVPDDKLTWTPTPTAKSALRLAAHAGMSGHFFASMIRGQKSEFTSPQEAFAFMDKEEQKITTRAQAVKALEDGMKDVISALETLTDAQVKGTAQTIVGEMPMEKLIFFPGYHLGAHAAQIDYIQTCYGDLDPHMG